MNKKHKNLSVTQGILWNLWGNLFYYGTQWVVTILVARVLGYRAAGIYNLAMSVTNAFAAIAMYGMRNYQISDIDNKYNSGDYATSRIITSIVSVALCTIFVLCNKYDAFTTACVLVYMLFRISEVFFDYLSAIYQNKWKLDLLGISLSIRSCIFLAVFLVSSVLTKNLLIIIICIAISMNTAVILFDYRAVLKLDEIAYWENRKKVIRLLIECAPLAIFTTFSSSIASIPRYFLEMYMGEEMLGIYASVAAPVLIVQLLATNIFNPMLSVFTECIHRKNREHFSKLLIKCTLIFFVITISAIVVAKLVGRWGLILLFGNSIDGFEYLLAPLILCASATAVLWFVSGLLTIIRAFKSIIIGNGIAAVICCVLSMLLIPSGELLGATYALLIGDAIGVVLLVILFFSNKKIKELLSNM